MPPKKLIGKSRNPCPLPHPSFFCSSPSWNCMPYCLWPPTPLWSIINTRTPSLKFVRAFICQFQKIQSDDTGLWPTATCTNCEFGVTTHYEVGVYCLDSRPSGLGNWILRFWWTEGYGLRWENSMRGEWTPTSMQPTNNMISQFY